MKKVLSVVSIILVVVFCALSLTACGNIKTTVDAKYDDGFAKDYASKVSQDSNGNNVYEFTDDQYVNFLRKYNNVVCDEAVDEALVADQGQYTFLNEEGTEYTVGIKPETIQNFSQDELKAQAAKAGKIVMKYNMNTKAATGKITVIYKNANTGDEVFRIEVTAE